MVAWTDKVILQQLTTSLVILGPIFYLYVGVVNRNVREPYPFDVLMAASQDILNQRLIVTLFFHSWGQ